MQNTINEKYFSISLNEINFNIKYHCEASQCSRRLVGMHVPGKTFLFFLFLFILCSKRWSILFFQFRGVEISSGFLMYATIKINFFLKCFIL